MSTQLIVVTLDELEYGINVSDVNGILRSKKYTVQTLPGTHKVLEGMINIRNKVSYIFNLRSKFNLTPKGVSEESKFVMLNRNNATTGFVVDEVTDIVRLEDSDLEMAPSFVSGINGRYIKGIGKIRDRLIVILDPEKIISSEEYDMVQG